VRGTPGDWASLPLPLEANLVRKRLGQLTDDDQRALRHAIALVVG
jgi:hypothetical protein